MRLTEQYLTDITVALVLAYMKDNVSEYGRRCGELHNRIQVVRRKDGVFESVD